MPKFHISNRELKKCSTTPEKCPIGEGTPHFEGTQKEAETWLEDRNAQEMGGSFARLSNKVTTKTKQNNDPATAHIRAADERIADMKDDLDARDSRVSVAQQLANELPDGELEEMMKVETRSRQAGIGYMRGSSDETILGVAYDGDHKAEEEQGIADISRALREGRMPADAVSYEEEDGKGILSIRAGAENFFYRDDKELSRNTAVRRFDTYTSFEDMRAGWKHERKSVQELRSELKGKVKPLPTKKDELIRETIRLEKEARGEKREITPPQGEFQHGKVLTIVSDNNAMKAMMRKSKEAHEVGSLRVGWSTNPFSNGALFYDDRDMSKADKIAQIREEEAHKAAKENVKGTWDKLRDHGMVYAISPRVSADLKDINDAGYWLNFYPDRSQHPERKQMFGHFNKQELDQMATGDFSAYDEKEERLEREIAEREREKREAQRKK